MEVEVDLKVEADVGAEAVVGVEVDVEAEAGACGPSACGLSGADDHATLTSAIVGETEEQRAERMEKVATSQPTATSQSTAPTTDSSAMTQCAKLKYTPCESRREWHCKAVGSNEWECVTYNFIQKNCFYS